VLISEEYAQSVLVMGAKLTALPMKGKQMVRICSSGHVFAWGIDLTNINDVSRSGSSQLELLVVPFARFIMILLEKRRAFGHISEIALV